MKKVIVYIACSLDGYIAKPNDDLGFLTMVERPGEDYGYGEFIQTIDTVIVGRRTYEWVMEHVPQFSHSDKNSFVITRTPRPAIGNTQFYTGDLKELVEGLKRQGGKNIFVDGGAEIVNELLQLELIDEITVSYIPILLGGGTALFKAGIPEQVLELVSAKSFESGLLQAHYRLKHHSR